MDRDGTVLGYNKRESRLSGLPPAEVTGRNFFVDVGRCTNNFLVAQRYADSDDLDEQLDYMFTFRMAPTPVRKRCDMGTVSSSDRTLRTLALRVRPANRGNHVTAGHPAASWGRGLPAQAGATPGKNTRGRREGGVL
jgi:hypothetical protein